MLQYVKQILFGKQLGNTEFEPMTLRGQTNPCLFCKKRACNFLFHRMLQNKKVFSDIAFFAPVSTCFSPDLVSMIR